MLVYLLHCISFVGRYLFADFEVGKSDEAIITIIVGRYLFADFEIGKGDEAITCITIIFQ